MSIKLLIANRGEIALRIIRTCKKLGIRTVLVHSEPDRESLAAQYADETYPLDGSTPAETYLNISEIATAGVETGCDGVHPGYGFLAEEPAFVQACEEKGLVFIGPSSASLEKLRNKVVARNTMIDVGVPVIPASGNQVKSEDEAASIADQIGYPVILKAVYGGGGRGMRIARTAEEVRRLLRVTRLESESAFGRDAVYIEKRLSDPRHVEIQAIADKRGKIITLGERECSIQRRNQKLLEEAPSVAANESIRKSLNDAARRGLGAAGYENVGTVEFLLEQSGDFYFLEVNKRLQVEHLVTELTTGVDIVEQQINVAFDLGLNLSQDEVRVNGWAVNCRINAEEPRKSFTPSPGKIIRFRPPTGPGVRVDSALYPGYTIPEHYDSLIAKIATWGRDRSEAIRRMQVALDEIEIVGVPTTVPLHQALIRDDRFIRGDFHTTYLNDVLPRLNSNLLDMEKFAVIAVAAHTAIKSTLVAPRRSTGEESRWRSHARSELTRTAQRR